MTSDFARYPRLQSQRVLRGLLWLAIHGPMAKESLPRRVFLISSKNCSIAKVTHGRSITCQCPAGTPRMKSQHCELSFHGYNLTWWFSVLLPTILMTATMFGMGAL